MLVSKENSSSCSIYFESTTFITKSSRGYRKITRMLQGVSLQKSLQKNILQLKKATVCTKLKLFLWMLCAKFIQFQLFLVKLFEF